MYYCYIPVVIVGATAFMLRAFLVIPLAYFHTCIFQLKKMIRVAKISYNSLVIEASLLLFIIALGVPYLIILTFIDCGLYIASLYFSKNSKNIKNKYEEVNENGFNNIHPDLFRILLRVLEAQNEEDLNVKELVIYFRNELKIETQIGKLLFSFRDGLNHKPILVNSLEVEDAKFDVNEHSINETPKDVFDNNKSRCTRPCLRLPVDRSSNENTNSLKAFIHGKPARYILNQYSAVKRFLNCNAVPKFVGDHTKKEPVSLTVLAQRQLRKVMLRRRYIQKSKLLQVIREESEKAKFMEAIHGIKKLDPEQRVSYRQKRE